MHHVRIDRLSLGDSPIHRLDARGKLIVAIVFTVFVVQIEPTAVSILSYYAIWPFAVLIFGKVPLKFTLRQILFVSPFIMVLAASCLFFDRTETVVSFGNMHWHITVGLLRFCAIIGKFIITVAAVIGLIATTRFSDLLDAMRKLGVPKILVAQLGFLYRYIFMLIEKTYQMLRARAGRKLVNLGPKIELKTAAAMVATMALQSIDTAQRVSIAMSARGFNGNLKTISRSKLGKADLVFIALLTAYLFVLHFLTAGA